MVWRCEALVTSCVLAMVVAGVQAADQPTGVPEGAEAAIRATAASFAEAFNRSDAPAVAELWIESGTLADDRGQHFQGRPAIEAEYSKFFGSFPGAKMDVTITSLDFPTSALAIEDGISRLSLPHASVPTASSYTAVHVLQNGKWLMASVRERSTALSPAESHLQDLAWMVGNWAALREGRQLQATFRWVADNKFIQRDFTIRQHDAVVSSGVQLLGWDPQTGQIRSWSFDSSGGYGQSVWSVTAQGWSIESRGVLADGTPTASRESLTRPAGEQDAFSWRSTHRTVGIVTVPDSEEVVMKRVLEK